MAAKALKRQPPVRPAQVTTVGQIIGIVEKHIDTTEAILKTYEYATEEDMNFELRTVNKNLKEAVEDLDNVADHEKFQQLIKELKLVDKDDFDAEKLLDLLSDKDIDSKNLIKLIGTEAVYDHLIENGYACIKVNNMRDRDKLETFLKSEIYPNYHDQESYLII